MSAQPQRAPAPRPPSFSLVVETENLAFENPESILRCLACLERQDLPLGAANEVIVTNSGDLPPELAARVAREHPSLRFVPLPEGTGYYEAKMLGAAATTGDVVVFCDSDVEVEPGWLRALVAAFESDRDVRIVGGETSYRITGPYSLAAALTFQFPPFSGRHGLRRSRGYAANSFAMRRELLERHPIPTGGGLRHGNCRLHASGLRGSGVPIWQQPDARATHALLRPGSFLRRFFLGGHHSWRIHRRDSGLRGDATPAARLAGHVAAAARIAGRQLVLPFYRLPAALRGHPGRAALLPLAAPLVLAATLAYLAGLCATVLRPESDFSGWTDRS